MLKCNSKKFFFFFLIVSYTFCDCQQYHCTEMDAHLAKSEMQSTSFLEAQPAYEATTSVSQEGKFVVVYLHGLKMDAHESDTVAAACQKSFGNQVINIQPKCREGFKSAYLSINEQAKKVVAEIKATLHNICPQYSEEELKALPMNLFGYSQGGIVACTVAANHRDEFNIKSVIAAHSPLSGTDALDNTKSDVNEFNAKAKSGLKAIGHPNTSLLEAKALGILLNNSLCRPVVNLIARGVRDMRTNSSCTANIKAFVREGKHNIPILLIAGYISNLDEYFDFLEEDNDEVNEFIKAYALLTTRQKDGQHDLLISVKRQLCRSDSFESLTTSRDDSVYPSHVRTYVAEETIHCYNLMPVLSDFPVNHGKTLFESDETIAVITDFIAEKIGQDNNLSRKK